MVGKASSGSLRHKCDYAWDAGVYFEEFYKEMYQRARNSGCPWNIIPAKHDWVAFVIRTSGKLRYESQHYLDDPNSDTPARVRASQGHSKKPVSLGSQERISVTSQHTKELWHATTEQGRRGIMKGGIIPGGEDRHGGRIESFWSIMDPRIPVKRDPTYYLELQGPWRDPVMEPYPYSGKDITHLIVINMEMAEATGARFQQTRALSVQTVDKVPPEHNGSDQLQDRIYRLGFTPKARC